ncbi:MAG: SRPBCC domain-containing protein [Pseudomonadota bacterium]
MKFEGSFSLVTGREEAFALLTDPWSFAPNLPRYHSIKRTRDSSTDVTLKFRVGKFGISSVKLRLDTVKTPSLAIYKGSGFFMGGPFTVSAGLDLSPVKNEETQVDWRGSVQFLNPMIHSFGAKSLESYAIEEIELAVKSIQKIVDPHSA